MLEHKKKKVHLSEEGRKVSQREPGCRKHTRVSRDR